jgi:hypothetical protein
MMFKLLVFLTLSAAPAWGQDLYEAPLDPQSSFVRIIAPNQTVAVIGGQTFDAFAGGVTPFLNVAAGEIAVTAGTAQGKGVIEPASFYTFAPAADGSLMLLKDAIANSPVRADLVFYNMSDLDLVDLFVPAIGAMAIEGIAPATSRQVSLKAPLTLELQVQSKGVVLANLPAIDMQRRAGVTVVFSGSAGAYTAFSAQNTYAN